MRRPCFIEAEDVGLASLAHNTEDVSSNDTHNPFCTKQRRRSRNSYRSLSSLSPSSSPKGLNSKRVYNLRCEEQKQHHFLEACFLCKKHLADNADIFMYRGDAPFCSEECRDEQIDRDELKEKNWSLSESMKVIRQEQMVNSAPTKTQNYHVRTGAAAVAAA
ncbi:hypothetical protein GIB67_015365 [Kingdonia uniflora]|uniref:FLZ-type domain-containing protein n=1 Tax=Kingdonia uniflora TaxID=39325 RepID=A0A7J7KYY6_9MAGN|nr:hypothetical protein GIB67_015365 [Kingdonia uniflora]